jgi:phage-related protein
MAEAQAQYLRIYDDGGTYQRWQSFYVNQVVSWDGVSWEFQPFEINGITAGLSGDETSVTLTMPALPALLQAATAARSLERLVELKIYTFDPAIDDEAPQSGQQLLATFVGQVVDASATLSQINLALGSALAPVGVSIPPRTMTTRLIGKGCRL